MASESSKSRMFRSRPGFVGPQSMQSVLALNECEFYVLYRRHGKTAARASHRLSPPLNVHRSSRAEDLPHATLSGLPKTLSARRTRQTPLPGDAPPARMVHASACPTSAAPGDDIGEHAAVVSAVVGGLLPGSFDRPTARSASACCCCCCGGDKSGQRVLLHTRSEERREVWLRRRLHNA